jgi:hypothetical protein
MQVRLTTTISTLIEVTSGASFEEARAEIFSRYGDKLDGDNYEIEDIQSSQANCASFDTIVGTEVRHSFEEVK